MSVYERIQHLLLDGGVLLDGALGSELVRRGVRWRGHGLRTDPEAVQALHVEYIAAGADAIRTNTFGLNPRIYLNVFRNREHMRHIGAPGLETRARDLTYRAVEIARAAREAADGEVAIGGAMGPLEHPFRPDLAPDPTRARSEHAEIAGWLADAEVDFLLLEMLNTIDEARAATEAARATGLPVWVTFALGPEGEILSGESLVEGVAAVEAAGAEVIGVDAAPAEDVTAALPKLRAATEKPIAAWAQIGKFDPPSWKFEFHPRFRKTEEWPPERYAEAADRWRSAGARVVAGGPGTRPEHIRALRERL